MSAERWVAIVLLLLVMARAFVDAERHARIGRDLEDGEEVMDTWLWIIPIVLYVSTSRSGRRQLRVRFTSREDD